MKKALLGPLSWLWAVVIRVVDGVEWLMAKRLAQVVFCLGSALLTGYLALFLVAHMARAAYAAGLSGTVTDWRWWLITVFVVEVAADLLYIALVCLAISRKAWRGDLDYLAWCWQRRHRSMWR